MFKSLLFICSLFWGIVYGGGGKSLQGDLPLGRPGDLYQFNFKIGDEQEFKLIQFKGKPVLIINIATRCGYTKQLDDLEKLYQQYKDLGLIIIGIPSNDFLSQTPEGNKEVVEFCRLKYGVTFPVVTKVKVLEQSHPFFKYLRELRKKEVSWNFEKFLFDKNGQLVNSFNSGTTPLDETLKKAIKNIL